MKKIALATILFISHSCINGMYPNVTLPMCNPTGSTVVNYNAYTNSDFTFLTIYSTSCAMFVVWGLGICLEKWCNSYQLKKTKNITQSLWITTSDNKTFLFDMKKGLPKSGLRSLLKTYNHYFGKHNNERNPIQTNYSANDYQLLKKACRALDYNMSKWNFTEEEQITLFKIASASQILPLYLALINPIMQTNTIDTLPETNKTILSSLFHVLSTRPNEEIFSLCSRLAMLHCCHKKDSSNNHKEISDDSEVIHFPRTKKYILTVDNTWNRPYIYDTQTKKKYYLPMSCLAGANCATPEISPDGHYIATFCHDKSLICLWNISDLNNIRCHKPFYHHNVTHILFNPNSSSLISGADNGTVELWNFKKFSHKKKITPTILIANNIIDEMAFTLDGTTLAVRHSNNKKIDLLTLINIKTFQEETIFPVNKYPCYIFPNKSNFIIYTTYNEENRKLFTITTPEGITLYTREIPKKTRYFCEISDNNQYIAVNFPQEKMCDFLTIDHALNIQKKTISKECDYINDDGSFYTHTPHSIDLCNPHTHERTTLYYAPHKVIYKVKIKPDENIITYKYYADGQQKRKKQINLLSPEMHKNIKHTVETATPLQYMLIESALEKYQKNHVPLSISPNSLNHHALQSFGHHEKMMTEMLQLEIKNK